MKHVRFSVLLLMAINLLNLNWLQAEDKEASPFVWVDKAAEAYRAGKVKEAVQFADRAGLVPEPGAEPGPELTEVFRMTER